jgi:hypothetical protein
MIAIETRIWTGKHLIPILELTSMTRQCASRDASGRVTVIRDRHEGHLAVPEQCVGVCLASGTF